MAKGSFRDYVTRIDDYGLFDLVVVDGRARNDCIKYGAGHVKPGGMLVLDNSDRARYQDGTDILAARGWPREDFFGAGPYNAWFWMTSVWTRP
jgi:hypothetical protein